MADEKRNYPQIPSNVWWGVRELLHLKPTAIIDGRLLATHLGVQESAAKAYVKQLSIAGILDEEGKATDLAKRWRLDESYVDAADEIVTNTYPDSLRTACPPGTEDREKVVNWFMLDGLGKGAAGNKAATYLLIAKREPGSSSTSGKATTTSEKKSTRSKPKEKPEARNQSKEQKPLQKNDTRNAIPLNLNLQIHISADASSEQIDQIFKSMRAYLYDDG